MPHNNSELACGFLQSWVYFAALMLFYVTILEMLVFTEFKG